MSVFWIVILVVYGLVGVLAVMNTLAEGLGNPNVGWLGLCAGCVASLLWLPTLLVIVVWQWVLRRKEAFRQSM
jgi:hypothetical protein